MSGDFMQYNFDANHDHLNTLDNKVAEVGQLQERVKKVFETLYDVFDGGTAAAIHGKALEIDRMFTELTDNVSQSQARARAKNDEMQDLDRYRAANI
ncbi:hypothetical protein [Mycobacteroides saopaulense]|uniref:ESX-1 secretion-associated protein n=1 Tax=Mycobacteroides saopaulense TaxID=1578165 RepID=A0ABX3BWH5_9MYCO|nr:hypothetical protein [Mycobacteroides saopaulense]OHT81181.1 hypothetical protein BKG68_23350 [Mycobacteroides saopaulense]OHU07330.1 hypothetical protein BKG73_18955 [Mycobacteroides saopaulense]